MAWLQFEAMRIPKIKTSFSIQYIDHNLLQEDNKNMDDHLFLQSACQRFGVWFSRPGNGVSHPVHMQNFGIPGKTMLGSDSHTPTCGGLGMMAHGIPHWLRRHFPGITDGLEELNLTLSALEHARTSGLRAEQMRHDDLRILRDRATAADGAMRAALGLPAVLRSSPSVVVAKGPELSAIAKALGVDQTVAKAFGTNAVLLALRCIRQVYADGIRRDPRAHRLFKILRHDACHFLEIDAVYAEVKRLATMTYGTTIMGLENWATAALPPGSDFVDRFTFYLSATLDHDARSYPPVFPPADTQRILTDAQLRAERLRGLIAAAAPFTAHHEKAWVDTGLEPEIDSWRGTWPSAYFANRVFSPTAMGIFSPADLRAYSLSMAEPPAATETSTWGPSEVFPSFALAPTADEVTATIPAAAANLAVATDPLATMVWTVPFTLLAR
jgi:hypothetical protein